jgi:hypothetical protein
VIGEGSFVPDKSHFSNPLPHPSYYSKYWVERVAKSFDWTEVRCGYTSQQATGLVSRFMCGVMTICVYEFMLVLLMIH